MNAEHCVYFADWEQAKSISQLAGGHLVRRQPFPMRVDEGELAGSEDSSIIHLWEKQPELEFSLPLSSLRFQAKRIPMGKRVNLYRQPLVPE